MPRRRHERRMKAFRLIAIAAALFALTLTGRAEGTDVLRETFDTITTAFKDTPQPVFVILLRIGFIFAIYSIICGQLFKDGAPQSFVVPALALLGAIVFGMWIPFHKIEFKPGLKALLLFLSLIATAVIPYFGARWLSDDTEFHTRFRWILYGVGMSLFVFQFASL